MDKGKLYLAYGSNLNLEQMARRCPTAKALGTARLFGWRLLFWGSPHSAVATIERDKGFFVPVLIWRIRQADECALDRYEGWPYLYRKANLPVEIGGSEKPAMAYIMNQYRGGHGTPVPEYFHTIRQGYESSGFDLSVLEEAVLESKRRRDV